MKSLGILVNNTIQVTNNLAPLKLLEWKISLTNGSMVSLQNKYHKLFKKFKKSKLHIHELINKEAKNSTTSFFFVFNCYLAAPRPTLDHSQGDSLTIPMLITVF